MIRVLLGTIPRLHKSFYILHKNATIFLSVPSYRFKLCFYLDPVTRSKNNCPARLSTTRMICKRVYHVQITPDDFVYRSLLLSVHTLWSIPNVLKFSDYTYESTSKTGRFSLSDTGTYPMCYVVCFESYLIVPYNLLIIKQYCKTCPPNLYSVSIPSVNINRGKLLVECECNLTCAAVPLGPHDDNGIAELAHSLERGVEGKLVFDAMNPFSHGAPKMEIRWKQGTSGGVVRWNPGNAIIYLDVQNWSFRQNRQHFILS